MSFASLFFALAQKSLNVAFSAFCSSFFWLFHHNHIGKRRTLIFVLFEKRKTIKFIYEFDMIAANFQSNNISQVITIDVIEKSRGKHTKAHKRRNCNVNACVVWMLIHNFFFSSFLSLICQSHSTIFCSKTIIFRYFFLLAKKFDFT